MNSDPTQQYCAFCGLPLPRSPSLGKSQAPLGEIEEYCCTGCRMVAGVEHAQAEQGQLARGMLRLGLGVFFAMNVMVFTMALWSYDVYPTESFDNPLAQVLRGVFRWGTMLFSVPVLWLLGGPIVENVWQSLRRVSLTTDLLILLGVGAAYLYSFVSVVRGAGHVYFEVGVMVLLFVSLGRWLEAKGKRRTGESLDRLSGLLPPTVRRRGEDGVFGETPRSQVVTGDVLRILPGERFPVDGAILAGSASVDQQMLSGESQPVTKQQGELVYSGTLNVDGDLQIEVTAADGKETLSRLVAMVRLARRAKGRKEQLVDRIAAWFIPAVCLIAIAAGIYHGRQQGLDYGIMITLAVVLIACPCALGLATPMAIWTALGRAAEKGVLFRSGLVMERLAHIQTACFDKTGTLTLDKPELTASLTAPETTQKQLLSITAQLAGGSNHPLSQAVLAEAERHGLTTGTTRVTSVAGKGVWGEIEGLGTVQLGSRAWFEELGLQIPGDLEQELTQASASQVALVAWAGEVRGAFCFAEQLRPEAPTAVASCRRLGLQLQILTGDHADRAAAIGQSLGLPLASGQLPQDKLAAIQELSQQGGVAMIGEGLNDAPALAEADVGVALGCGADVSRDAAGVCLLADDLRRFPWAVGLARQTSRVVKQNLFWAFLYNCIGIALAATGRLNPILAAIAMAASSLLVVANSLRLNRFADLADLTQQLEKAQSAPVPALVHAGQGELTVVPEQEMVATTP